MTAEVRMQMHCRSKRLPSTTLPLLTRVRRAVKSRACKIALRMQVKFGILFLKFLEGLIQPFRICVGVQRNVNCTFS